MANWVVFLMLLSTLVREYNKPSLYGLRSIFARK